ncbi:MAG: hypothetical protein FJ271_29440 [Planctomycetes bacterium]|nr:hypothetical protein [Planctomycetota bacterium]
MSKHNRERRRNHPRPHRPPEPSTHAIASIAEDGSLNIVAAPVILTMLDRMKDRDKLLGEIRSACERQERNTIAITCRQLDLPAA